MNNTIVVCGAGGYVGSRLVKYLREKQHLEVRAIFSKLPPGDLDGGEYLFGDLKDRAFCASVVKDARWVFNLAASVGGIGYVASHNADCLANVLINTNLVLESAKAGVSRYFFASSSCVYPDASVPLLESYSDQFCSTGGPMGGYGWEKLYSEQLCLAFAAEKNLPCSIARYHGIYGPDDNRAAGRDHVVASICRKIINAKITQTPEICIWGDGTQTRSLLHVDDCVEGTYRLMKQEVTGPVNLAHPVPVSVNDIVDAFEDITGFTCTRFYQKDPPVGRKHKVSDNTLLQKSLNWQPATDHKEGFREVYRRMWEEELRTRFHKTPEGSR